MAIPALRDTGWLSGYIFLRWALLFNLAIPCPGVAGTPPLQIVYMAQEQEVPPALSNLDPIVTDKGIQGARLAVEDNNTTGRFTGQAFALKEVIIPRGGDVAAPFRNLVAGGSRFFVTNLPAAVLRGLPHTDADDDFLIFDAATADDALRNQDCRAEVLHMLPSRAMRADALAQYFLMKRWRDWFLVIGPAEEDRLFAAALKRSAQRFGMRIVAERVWQHTHDARRTAQSEVPVFTQGVDYDILIVADEAGLFGEYLTYRTWLPRPVAGTQGLVPTAWHRTHEQWGAVQLQNRFLRQAGRWMGEQDYAAWLAVRAIGEAATRTGSVEFDKIKAYLLSEDLALAGFKGAKLSFRAWDGQLRQPVLLAADRALVTVAPIEGFLHPKNELDTLGYDAPESECKFSAR